MVIAFAIGIAIAGYSLPRARSAGLPALVVPSDESLLSYPTVD